MGTIEQISDPDWAIKLIKKGITPNKVAHAVAYRSMMLLAKEFHTNKANIRRLAERWEIKRTRQLITEYGYKEGA